MAPEHPRRERNGRKRWLDAVILLAVAGVALAAIVTGIRFQGGRDAASPPLQATAAASTEADTAPPNGLDGELPSIVPLAGALRAEGGILWWVGTECSAGSLELASGSARPFEQAVCALWPAADGGAGVALVGGGLEVFTDRGASFAALARPAGYLGSQVSWSPDGSRFAYCLGSSDGFDVRLVSRAGEVERIVDGACSPAWLPDGTLAVARDNPPSIVAGGKTLLDNASIARLLGRTGPGRQRVAALFASGDRLFASLVSIRGGRERPLAAALAVLSPDGSVDFSAELPRDSLPAAVGLSPDGQALWYFEEGGGNAVLIALPGGRRLPPFGARWLAWSPDGAYLAAATDEGIVLYSWPETKRLDTVPTDAAVVAWTRSR